MRKYLFCLLVILLPAGPAMGQPSPDTGNDDEDDPYETLSWFMYGINCLSDNVYLGRKDTLAMPYISPYIGYHHKTGLYAKLAAAYAPAKGRIDLVTVAAGYEHTFGEHINTGINAEKYFYNAKTNNIRGNTKGNAGVYIQYGNDWVQPLVSLDMNFNNKTDYILGLQLDHEFKLINNRLNIIPAIAMNAGTQHFYDEYFVNNLVKKDKSLKIKQVLADAGKFKTRDYELSTKVTYRVSKWLFSLTATYAIPVNPTVITFPKHTYTEQLSNSFFMELDVCHR